MRSARTRKPRFSRSARILPAIARPTASGFMIASVRSMVLSTSKEFSDDVVSGKHPRERRLMYDGHLFHVLVDHQVGGFLESHFLRHAKHGAGHGITHPHDAGRTVAVHVLRRLTRARDLG